MPFGCFSKKFRPDCAKNRKKNKSRVDDDEDLMLTYTPQRAVSMYGEDQLPSGFTARVLAADKASYHMGRSMGSIVTTMMEEEVEHRDIR